MSPTMRILRTLLFLPVEAAEGRDLLASRVSADVAHEARRLEHGRVKLEEANGRVIAQARSLRQMLDTVVERASRD